MFDVLDKLDAYLPDKTGGQGSVENRDESNAKDHNAELRDMQRQADLLGLVQADTGEAGRQNENYISFKTCPICGHRDCFRLYPSTNSWACFGASNENTNADGHDGGGYLKYLLRTGRASDNTEAVKLLREATGNEYQLRHTTKAISDHAEKKADTLLLPPWEHVRADNPPKLAPSLIDGVLRRGHVGTLIAKAKSGKSWAGIALCVAVATGGTWLGFECGQGACLYIDPELDRRSLDKRFGSVATAMGQEPATVRERVVRWGLRGVVVNGKAPTIEDVLHDLQLLRERDELPEFALIVVDSCSALLGSRDENAAADVRAYFNTFLRVTETTGAALLAIHHEGKAMSGDREAMGRSRGSAAWDDCPDVVLSLVQTFPPSGDVGDYLQHGESGYLLECAAIREFRGFEPKRLIWNWPCFRMDAEGVTDGWKPKSSVRRGGKASGDARKDKSLDRARRCTIHLLAHMLEEGIGKDGIPANEAAEYLTEAMGEAVKASTLKGYVEDSSVLEVWQRSKQRWRVVPATVPKWERRERLLE